MKKAVYSFVILSLFLMVLEAKAQAISEIAESDAQAHAKMFQKHESGLVNNYDLKYHRFRLLVDPAQQYIRGSVVTYFVPTTASMSSIQFELSEALSADSAYHNGFRIMVQRTGNLITVPFGEIIPQASLDSVVIYYHGVPTGSGFGSFVTSTHSGTPVLWTLSEPFGASEWWPSKNDLTDKIDSIDMFVAAPNAYKVASNGLLKGTAPYGANLTVSWWKHTYPIVSYLIAISVTNYAIYSDWYVTDNDSLEVLNYVFPENLAMQKERSAQTVSFLQLFEELFTPYPFRKEKYGHAEFGWGGGMEHQTMTFLGSNAFNFNYISHELAHQWFGNMITCGSWHDIWLNEGFATYLNGIAIEKLVPDPYWPYWKSQNIASITNYSDGSVYCDDTTNVYRIFDSRLSYQKGAMVLHMLRWIIGDDAFFAGMKNYLEDPVLTFGFAMTKDYKQHMEAVSGRDLTDFFNSWIYGQGYPMYTVTCMQDESNHLSVSISQVTSHQSVPFYTLPVPIRFLGQQGDTLLIFNHTYSGQVFEADLSFTVDSVIFDPEMWLITANNRVTLGSTELPAGKYFRLLPNPATDRITADHNLGDLNDLKIRTLEGKELTLTSEKSGDRIVFNISELSNGMYLLQFRYDGKPISRKFIVSR